MTKKRTSALASMKLLFVVPVIGLVFLAISACRENTKMLPPPPPPPPPFEIKEEAPVAEAEVFTIVEEMPQYPGGIDALLKYVYANTVYPVIAKENNIQGRVIVKFCVTPTGGISQVSIFKGVAPELDKEAVRVVKTITSFKPGKQGGKPVPVWYILPINFKLK